MKLRRHLTFAGLLIIACRLPVLAGTVITNNLPANTAIININATQDGISYRNADQSLWYHPFYTGSATQLLKYTVCPGVYSFRIVNPADAARLFPALTTSQTNQIFTAWTWNSPWATDYFVFGSAAETNSTLPQLFDGGWTNVNVTGPFYANAAAAYAGAITNGTYNKIRTSPLGRAATVFTNTCSFTNAETLIFAIPDNILGDNGGGVSVIIAPVAPRLDIARADTDVIVFWLAAEAEGFLLQESTNLAVPTAWANTTNDVNPINGTNYLILTSPAGNLFFRLKK
jgi:hypothetical protein